MIFVAPAVFSQNLPGKAGKMLLLQPMYAAPQSVRLPAKAISENAPVKQVIAPDFYVTQLGFFCRQEIKFEKATKIPFRFRLGSIEECNRMEGKDKRN